MRDVGTGVYDIGYVIYFVSFLMSHITHLIFFEKGGNV